MTLDAVEFIRRFLLHALPSGFMRIRHFGFFANRVKKEMIRICRMLLEGTADLPERVEKTLRNWCWRWPVRTSPNVRSVRASCGGSWKSLKEAVWVHIAISILRIKSVLRPLRRHFICFSECSGGATGPVWPDGPVFLPWNGFYRKSQEGYSPLEPADHHFYSKMNKIRHGNPRNNLFTTHIYIDNQFLKP